MRESFISGCRYREYKTQQRKKAEVLRRVEKLEDITEGEKEDSQEGEIRRKREKERSGERGTQR